MGVVVVAVSCCFNSCGEADFRKQPFLEYAEGSWVRDSMDQQPKAFEHSGIQVLEFAEDGIVREHRYSKRRNKVLTRDIELVFTDSTISDIYWLGVEIGVGPQDYRIIRLDKDHFKLEARSITALPPTIWYHRVPSAAQYFAPMLAKGQPTPFPCSVPDMSQAHGYWKLDSIDDSFDTQPWSWRNEYWHLDTTGLEHWQRISKDPLYEIHPVTVRQAGLSWPDGDQLLVHCLDKDRMIVESSDDTSAAAVCYLSRVELSSLDTSLHLP